MNLKSPEPFWLLKNGIGSSYPSLSKDISTEILIVGGGITGSLIAHQCIQDGHEVTLVDKREICTGSTAATTAMLQYEIDVPLYKLIKKVGKRGAEACYKACSDAIDSLEKVVEQINSDCGFKKKYSLYFADAKKDVSGLQRELKARKEAGFKVQWLEKEEIIKKIKIHNTFGGILSEQGASVDAFKLAHDLIAWNAEQGLVVYDKTEVKSVLYKDNGIEARAQYGDRILAKKIIYCTGYESTEIIKEKFVKLLSTYAIVGERFEKKADVIKDMLIWNTADPYIYMRTTDDNRLLIGGGDESFKNDFKRNALLEKKSTYLESQLGNYLPDYDFRTDFSWAGTFGTTKDGLPYIGEHKDFPSAYFVLGFGGNGISFSVTGMQMVADYLRGKTSLLSPWFRFGR